MINANVYYVDRRADARYWLLTSGFGDGALDKQQKSIISSLVQEEVGRLTQSARLTISHTSVSLTTEEQTVRWRISQDSCLMVTRATTVYLGDPSMSVPTST